MKKLVAFSLLLPLCVCVVSADIVTERKREIDVPILGLTTRAYTETFKKDEPARAIASGKYLTSLGLYVFDPNGNCVARDDFSDPPTADDCGVVWVPAEQQAYSIEVRNAGVDQNKFQIALR